MATRLCNTFSFSFILDSKVSFFFDTIASVSLTSGELKPRDLSINSKSDTFKPCALAAVNTSWRWTSVNCFTLISPMLAKSFPNQPWPFVSPKKKKWVIIRKYFKKDLINISNTRIYYLCLIENT